MLCYARIAYLFKRRSFGAVDQGFLLLETGSELFPMVISQEVLSMPICPLPLFQVRKLLVPFLWAIFIPSTRQQLRMD